MYASEYYCSSAVDCSIKIQSAIIGDVIYLTQDITSSSGIAIDFAGQNGITFDCQDFLIDGLDNTIYNHHGIDLSNTQNNIIQNCSIVRFQRGINSYKTTNTKFKNIITSDNRDGFSLRFSSQNNIQYAHFIDNEFDLVFSARYENECDNQFLDVNSTSGTIGLISSSVILSNQSFNIIYLCDADYAQLNSITANFIKLYLTDNAILDTIFGVVELVDSDKNSLTNIYANNANYGITNFNSDYTIFDSIHVINNSWSGLHIQDSSSVVVTNSFFVEQDTGISILNSNNLLIYDNYFNNTNNLVFLGDSSLSSTVVGNIVNNCSLKNIINGTCIGGNYWATRSGLGFSESCLDSNYDGFCDASYNFSFNSSSGIDYFPLSGFIPDCFIDSDCDNTFFCDGMETCVQGICQSGIPQLITDDIMCTQDLCDDSLDLIIHTPQNTLCEDGNMSTINFCNVTLKSCDFVLNITQNESQSANITINETGNVNNSTPIIIPVVPVPTPITPTVPITPVSKSSGSSSRKGTTSSISWSSDEDDTNSTADSLEELSDNELHEASQFSSETNTTQKTQESNSFDTSNITLDASSSSSSNVLTGNSIFDFSLKNNISVLLLIGEIVVIAGVAITLTVIFMKRRR